MTSFIKKYVGDKSFYSTVVKIAVPIMLQMAITNFVSLLDNIMVGSLGTESVSGVAIVNQFVFIYQLLIFGAISAAGIFTSQFFGSGDIDGVRHTFRFKLIINLCITVICMLVFSLFSDPLIRLFLAEDSTVGDTELAFAEAKRYLSFALIGLAPYAISQSYASTLRETQNTVPPMISSFVAVGVNFLLNCLLIFGLFGFPALGVVGAAIATSVSRFAELAVLIIWTHRNERKCRFIKGAYSSFSIPKKLAREIAVRGLPLILNEFMWSLAITMRNQSYSTRGMDALAATSMSSTIFNLFSMVYYAMGSAIAIIIGNKLGMGEIEESKSDARKLIAFSVLLSIFFGSVLACLSPLFPMLYDVDTGVRSLTSYMLTVCAILMPFSAYSNASYYTIRSSGKAFLTMLMDSGFMWAVVVPVSLILAHFTSFDIYILYLLCQGTDVIKAIIGSVLLRKSNWAVRIIE